MKTEEAIGWGLHVGGVRPYIAYTFSTSKQAIEAQMFESYHRAVKVAIVPLSEWKRLKKLDKIRQQKILSKGVNRQRRK